MFSTYLYKDSTALYTLSGLKVRSYHNMSNNNQMMIPSSTNLNPTATSTTSTTNFQRRGAFIVLEGIDRCGKTTQCALLLKHLVSLSLAALAIRFPDRTTAVGQVIDQYLKSSSSTRSVDDRAIHLLFSANRWEAIPSILETLHQGKHIICDRYAYSGVAFTSAKIESDMDPATATALRAMGPTGNEEGIGFDLEWCMAPDRGLPAPDCVIFLNLSQDESEKRGGYVSFYNAHVSFPGHLFPLPDPRQADNTIQSLNYLFKFLSIICKGTEGKGMRNENYNYECVNDFNNFKNGMSNIKEFHGISSMHHKQ